MATVFLFDMEDGTVIYGAPAPGCPLTIEEIAEKDTFKGRPFLLVDSDDLPDAGIFRDAWRVDFSKPHGYGMGHEEWYKHKASENYKTPAKVKSLAKPNIAIDMATARMIWRAHMAEARDARLEEMGRLYQLYVDQGLDPAPVVERRNALRDVTQNPAIDAAKTLDELKATWPSILDSDV